MAIAPGRQHHGLFLTVPIAQLNCGAKANSSVPLHHRPHPGDEVYVTGTFDNWSKSEQMEKVGDKFEKSVELPDTSERIYYKVGTSPVPLCLFLPCLQACTQSP
jgi:hypothetical protein